MRPTGLRIAGLAPLGGQVEIVGGFPLIATPGKDREQRFVRLDVDQPVGLGREARRPGRGIVVAFLMARGQRVEVAAKQHRCLRIIFIDRIEEMAGLDGPAGGIGAVFEMHRDDRHPVVADMHLAADCHASANARLTALRLEPAASRIEAHHERAKQRNGAGHRVAMKAFGIGDVAGGRPFLLVARVEFDELDAVSESMAKPVGERAQRMAVARARHAFIHLRQQHDIR